MRTERAEVLAALETVAFRQAINVTALAEKADQIAHAQANNDWTEVQRLGARMAALAHRTQVLADERITLEARRDAIEQAKAKA